MTGSRARVVAALGWAACIVGAVPACAADPAAARALGRLRKNLAPLSDLAAEVTVTTALKGFLTEQVYRQRYAYAFRRPASVRVDFREPAGRLVIARGRTVWVNGKAAQGTDKPEDAASPLSLWALSLGGPALDREYAITSFAEPQHQRLVGLALTPRSGGATAVRLKIWVDMDRGVVEESKVFGAEDALLSTSAVSKFARLAGMVLPVEITTLGCEGRCKTVVAYAGVRVNAGLSGSLFTP